MDLRTIRSCYCWKRLPELDLSNLLQDHRDRQEEIEKADGSFLYIIDKGNLYTALAAAGVSVERRGGGTLTVHFCLTSLKQYKKRGSLIRELFKAAANYGNEYGYSSVKVPYPPEIGHETYHKILGRISVPVIDPFTEQTWYETNRSDFESLCKVK